MDGFDDYLNKAVRVAYDELAAYVQKTMPLTDFRLHFLTAEYYNTLEKFIERPCGEECRAQSLQSSTPKPFEFEPLIAFEDIPDEARRSEARQIVKRVRAEHVPMIKKRLEELYDQDIVTKMPWASKELQSEMWQSW